MRLFRAKTTGKTHDFTEPGPDRELYLDHVKNVRKRILSGSVNHLDPVRRGDELVWIGSDGSQVIARVLQSHPTSVGSTWYFVTVRITGAEEHS